MTQPRLPRAHRCFAALIGLALLATACLTSAAASDPPSDLPTPSWSPSVITTGTPEGFDAS